MSRVSKQFYAFPKEVEHILLKIKQGSGGLNVVVGFGALDSKIDFVKLQNVNEVSKRPYLRYVIFSVNPCQIDCNTLDNFVTSNHDFAVLEIGRHVDNRLSETWLWSLSNNPILQKFLKALVAVINNETSAGMTVTNPQTKISEFYRSMRYSKGVAESAPQGLVLLPTAGNTIVTVPSQ